MKFKNSNEFLEYLQKVLHVDKPELETAEQIKWKNDFSEISIKRASIAGMEESVLDYKRNHYDNLINKYVEDLKNLLGDEKASEIGKNISIGSVNSNNINAVCTTDMNGNYAIVVASSIFTYLHKYGKLLIAATNPSLVVYCNRMSVKGLTQKDILSYLEELPKIYFAVNEPKGPMIQLADQSTYVHMRILEVAEKFILSHELGHYFKGHLNKNKFTELFLDDFIKLKNDVHIIEFEADDFAYNLITKEKSGYEPSLILSAISLLFQGMNSLNPYASESHPAPIERMTRLIKRVNIKNNHTLQVM